MTTKELALDKYKVTYNSQTNELIKIKIEGLVETLMFCWDIGLDRVREITNERIDKKLVCKNGVDIWN